MAKSKMQQLSPTHIRIVCECGLMHEVRRGEDGEFEYDYFLTNKSAPVEAPKAPDVPKKKQSGWSFWPEDENGKAGE